MAVTGVHHYALQVPDPDVGAEFYSAFGLARHDAPDGIRFRPDGRAQDQVQLYPGPAKRLHHLALSVAPGTLERTVAAALAAGARRTDPAPVVDDLTGSGEWLLDPEGNRLVLLDAPAAAWDTAPGQGRNTPGRLERPGEPVRAVEVVRPRRLGHVLLWAADLEAQTRFLTDGLGMLLSDLGGDEIAFVRGAAHVADHHHVALARGTAPGFHHAAFEVTGLDDIVAGSHRMADRGWKDGWGLGRHALGSNLFHYVRDPWGSFAEYFSDIDVIPADCGWVPQRHPAEVSLYRWGPDVPPYFMTNTDAR